MVFRKMHCIWAELYFIMFSHLVNSTISLETRILAFKAMCMLEYTRNLEIMTTRSFRAPKSVEEEKELLEESIPKSSEHKISINGRLKYSRIRLADTT